MPTRSGVQYEGIARECLITMNSPTRVTMSPASTKPFGFIGTSVVAKIPTLPPAKSSRLGPANGRAHGERSVELRASQRGRTSVSAAGVTETPPPNGRSYAMISSVLTATAVAKMSIVITLVLRFST